MSDSITCSYNASAEGAQANYSYDTWGNLTSATESFANGWSNPYRYDGRGGVRYDMSTGLYWMSVRAYDPTIGRFISHDPLGRAPLFFSDQPYAYAGNNPVSNVDPSGQRYAGASGSQTRKAAARQVRKTRVYHKNGNGSGCDITCKAKNVKRDAGEAMNAFHDAIDQLTIAGLVSGGASAAIAGFSGMSLQEFGESIAAKIWLGTVGGVLAELAVGYWIFEWEASQSVSWFKDKGNVDSFFSWATWLVLVEDAVFVVGASALAETVLAASFAVGFILGGAGVISTLKVAQREQDHEYK